MQFKVEVNFVENVNDELLNSMNEHIEFGENPVNWALEVGEFIPMIYDNYSNPNSPLILFQDPRYIDFYHGNLSFGGRIDYER